MMIQRIGVMSVVVLVLGGCSADKARIEVPAEIQAIRDSDRALLRAETERDLEEAMKYVPTERCSSHRTPLPLSVRLRFVRSTVNGSRSPTVQLSASLIPSLSPQQET